jgi:hypothetical protein
MKIEKIELFENYLKKNKFLLSRFKIFHYKFFLNQLLNFMGIHKFWVYFFNNKKYYKEP